MNDMWKWVKAMAQTLGPAAETLHLADHVAWATLATVVAFALFAPPVALDMGRLEWIAEAVHSALRLGPTIGVLFYLIGLVRRIAQHEDFI